jgi:broad specificity phosphatase PhoE
VELEASILAHWTVVRHGESTWNKAHIVQGQNDTSRLTDRGRLQASERAASLRGEKFDAVLSSDLTRCVETAELLIEVLGGTIVTSPLLRERSFGVLESGPSSALSPQLVGIEGTTVLDEDVAPVGGESLRDLYERAGRFVEPTIASYADARLLVVTHGGTIRALQAYVMGISMMEMEWGNVGNCSRWELEVPIRTS